MNKVQFGVLGGLLLVLVGLAALPVFAPNRTAPQYEYKIEAFKDAELQTDLARLGRGGWELVFARRALEVDADRNAGYEAIFKRPM